MATAQFLAAGSFGLFHATIKGWLYPEKATVLNQVFDLSKPENCLHHLASKNLDATKVAAATLAYHFEGNTCAACSHIAWAQRWSRILNHYNSGGRGYTLSGGLSEIISNAITTYGAQ